MLSATQRHRFLQKLFWNPIGAKVVNQLIRYELKFDTVIRGYSLIGNSNGERWILTLMDEKPVAFDVGFYDGASTKAILAVRPAAKVTGFDPSRFAGRAYEEQYQHDARITFANIGLSNSAGEITFYDYENMCNSLQPRKEMPGHKPTEYTVQIRTLDAYCRDNGLEHVNFAKIDAEGFDLHVLEGARDILEAQRLDFFMFEFGSGWASSKRYLWEVIEYFEPLPYRLFHLYNGFLCPLVYDIRIDSCCTLPAMYVGVSVKRLSRGDIPMRNYRF